LNKYFLIQHNPHLVIKQQLSENIDSKHSAQIKIQIPSAKSNTQNTNNMKIAAQKNYKLQNQPHYNYTELL